MSRKRLVDGLVEIGKDGGGDLFTKFLEEVECYQSVLDYQLAKDLLKKDSCNSKKSPHELVIK